MSLSCHVLVFIKCCFAVSIVLCPASMFVSVLTPSSNARKWGIRYIS